VKHCVNEAQQLEFVAFFSHDLEEKEIV
jgi:hypothetical protein